MKNFIFKKGETKMVLMNTIFMLGNISNFLKFRGAHILKQ
jgi:hypothetical protein